MLFEDKVMPHYLSMLASAKQKNLHMSLHENIIWSLIWCTAFDVNNKRYMPVYFILTKHEHMVSGVLFASFPAVHYTRTHLQPFFFLLHIKAEGILNIFASPKIH